MAITYRLRAEYASYGGGVISYGRRQLSFNVGDALTAGGGSIVTSDKALVAALDLYLPLFRYSDDNQPLVRTVDLKQESLSVGGTHTNSDVVFEVKRDVDSQARFTIAGNGTVKGYADITANQGANSGDGQVTLTKNPQNNDGMIRFGAHGTELSDMDYISLSGQGVLRTNTFFGFESGVVAPYYTFGYVDDLVDVNISADNLDQVQVHATRLLVDGGFGVFGSNGLGVRPTVTGSRGSNAALESLCTALASYGLITNSTS